MPDAPSSPDTALAAVAITRVFDAPREAIWKEWTEPTRFADWFGGQEVEVPLSAVSMQLRPGGAWSATTLGRGPGGRDIRWHGEFLEVVAPERLVFTISGLANQRPPDVVTVMLASLGDGRTEMRFRQQGQRGSEEYTLARARWMAEFDYISERLARTGSRQTPTP